MKHPENKISAGRQWRDILASGLILSLLLTGAGVCSCGSDDTIQDFVKENPAETVEETPLNAADDDSGEKIDTPLEDEDDEDGEPIDDEDNEADDDDMLDDDDDDMDDEEDEDDDGMDDDDDSNIRPLDDNWVTEWAIQAGDESATDVMIAAGPDNTVHVVSGDYYSDMKCDLRYAYYDGETWEDEKIPTGSPFCGEEANIALDSKNIPHVAFIDEAEIAICYAVKDGGWTIEQVVRPPGYTLAVGIDTDSNDSPHIVYDTTPRGEDSIIDKRPDRIEYGFWYAYKDGDTWKTEKITGGEPKGRTIAIDTLDIPHTAYIQEFENGAIYYAYRENGKWVSEKVTTGAMPNGDVDIDTDSANRPHLIYKNEDRNLIHAVKTDGSWHFETLKEATGEQQGVRICIDNQDKLHVYYSEDDKVRDNMVSKYMYYENNAWHTEDIAYGGEGDLSVGSDGIVHVCSGMAAPVGNAEWVRAAHRTGNQ